MSKKVTEVAEFMGVERVIVIYRDKEGVTHQGAVGYSPDQLISEIETSKLDWMLSWRE